MEEAQERLGICLVLFVVVVNIHHLGASQPRQGRCAEANQGGGEPIAQDSVSYLSHAVLLLIHPVFF
jgi:hypothetical protein